MDAFELCGLGLITAVLALTVKQYRPELALQVSIAGGAVLLLMCISQLSGILAAVRNYFLKSGLPYNWLAPSFKIIGIAYITQISSELCRDAGEGAVACKLELCGRVMMTAAALPSVLSLLETLLELAGRIEY